MATIDSHVKLSEQDLFKRSFDSEEEDVLSLAQGLSKVKVMSKKVFLEKRTTKNINSWLSRLSTARGYAMRFSSIVIIYSCKEVMSDIEIL